VLRSRSPKEAYRKRPWRSKPRSDNFEAHIEALKQMGRRVLRRLFGSGGAEDPFAAVRVPRNRNP